MPRSLSYQGDPVIEARHLDLGIPAADPRPSAPSVPADSQTRDGIQARWRQLSDQKSDLDAIEKAIVEDALRASGGIVARTARTLSVPRTGLISRMATLEIDPERFKET